MRFCCAPARQQVSPGERTRVHAASVRPQTAGCAAATRRSSPTRPCLCPRAGSPSVLVSQPRLASPVGTSRDKANETRDEARDETTRDTRQYKPSRLWSGLLARAASQVASPVIAALINQLVAGLRRLAVGAYNDFGSSGTGGSS